MKTRSYDIYKASGIIIEGRKVIATRAVGSSMYIQPGGKLEAGETEIQAVIRELYEELTIHVEAKDLEKIGDYYAEAANQPGKTLRLAAWLVKRYDGILQPSSEVEEVRSFNSVIPADIEIASILQHDIIPELKARDLID